MTGYTQFSSDPEEQEGYYYALNVEPWEGVTYSTEAQPEPKPLVDDGTLVLFLGKEAPKKKYVDFHYTDGSVVRYWVDVTAALPSRMGYAAMTKAQLVAEADSRGISVPRGASKSQIREALEG